jgi:hypothetical protein
MPLTLPELDDRRYADLVEEARGLLVGLAPSLTNHNPSDPVVTIAELFAYFTDALLFRLNYVTDDNRRAFLRLLNGPEWQAPAHRDGLDAEVRRTVLQLRSVQRAVTAADYELLAREADAAGHIARVRCVPGFDLSVADAPTRAKPSPGTVSVIVVPKAGNALNPLLESVATHLEPRRLLATRVRVVGPRFVPIQAHFTVRLLPDALESATRALIVDALTRYLDPLVGRDGDGWPFGRSVNVSEMYGLLDALPGVDFVTRTRVAGNDLDELSTDDSPGDRIVRNEANQLVGITLARDELVQPQIDPAQIVIQAANAVT